MAPSRRRKPKNAAASRSWNVGELVLAKVKGYPAWPAIVNNPEEWGYPSGLKKVLVCFFGTREIALCNPVDLQEFTEEKKLSLLGKRGKSSDFVRALNEIIESFDKLKKSDQVSGNDLFGETDLTVENTSAESFTKYRNGEPVPNSVEQRSAGETNGMEFVTEAVVSASATDTSLDGVMQLDVAHGNMMSAKHDNPTSIQARTRKSGNCSSDSRMCSRSLSELSMGDALSSYEGSNADLGCEDQTVLSDRVEFQTSGRGIKKKRKATEQRHHHDDKLRADLVISEDEIAKPDHVTYNESAALNGCAQQDGDEHLPLAKRARIRMGSHAGDGEGASLCEDEKQVEVIDSPNLLSDGALNCMLADGKSSERDLRITSPTKHIVENLVHKLEEPEFAPDLSSCPLNCNVDAQTSDTKMDLGHTSISHVSPVRISQPLASINCFIDGESALPLSKRINRALEAMSANVAEAGEGDLSGSPAVDAHGVVHLVSCSAECSEMPVVNDDAVKLGLGPVEDNKTGDSLASASEFCVGLNMESSERHGKTTCVVDFSNPEISEVANENVENAENKCGVSSPLLKRPVEGVEEQHLKPKSFEVGEKLDQLGFSTSSISADNSCKIGHRQESGEGSDPTVTHTNTYSILVRENTDDTFNGGSCNLKNILDSAHEDANQIKEPAVSEKDLDSPRPEFVKEETGPASPDSIGVPSETAMKLFLSDNCKYSYTSNTVSDNIANGQDSISCVSPPDSLLSTSKVESLSSFEGLVGSLTRSNKTIIRATEMAIECAKFGLASEVVEILVQSLESESSLRKKVDLFFLVDSITRSSRSLKGDCGMYPSLIQPLLPRLLLAAAPPGLSYFENQRQCLKVLRAWLERKILPESIIRYHIEELDAFCNLYHSSGSRRALRNERAFDDPVREMEGILVDEYGSNSSIQFPGFCMPPMRIDDDGGSDSDDDVFEAVTPERDTGNHDGGETSPTKVGKHSHILEDVDGELEMEDVAPCEFKTASMGNIPGADHNHMSLAAPPPPSLPPPSHHTPSVSTQDMHRSIPNDLPGNENYRRKHRESRWEQFDSPRVDTRTSDKVYRYPHEDQDFGKEQRRAYSFNEEPPFPVCDRASNEIHQVDGTFHERTHPPHSHPNMLHHYPYTQEQRSQTRRDFPPNHHPSRYRTHPAGSGNLHRDFDRDRYAPQSGNEDYWGPPSPSMSGQSYDHGSRNDHAPYPPPSYPHNKPAPPGNRRRVPPWLMNRMQFNPCNPPMGGPVPVGNRGPNNWKSR